MSINNQLQVSGGIVTKRAWVVFVFAIYVISLAQRIEAAPVIQIQSGVGTWITNWTSYDFPVTSSGASVSRGFTVFNDGNSVLSISNPSSAVTGAGYTQHSNVVLSPTIPSGSSSAFRIVFSQSSAGAYVGTVRLQTNTRIFQFTIRTHVNPSPYSAIRIICGDGTPIQNGGTYNFPSVDPNQLLFRIRVRSNSIMRFDHLDARPRELLNL